MRYKTIENAMKKQIHCSITLDDLISGRFYHTKKGWSGLIIDDYELDDLCNILGGRGKSKERIKEFLSTHYIKDLRSYGIFSRVVYNKYGWQYVAVQDYISELATVRKLIKE